MVYAIVGLSLLSACLLWRLIQAAQDANAAERKLEDFQRRTVLQQDLELATSGQLVDELSTRSIPMILIRPNFQPDGVIVEMDAMNIPAEVVPDIVDMASRMSKRRVMKGQ